MKEESDILKNFTPELLDEDRCRVWFLRWLYGRKILCPRCGSPLKKNRIDRFFAGKISYCSGCRAKFFPLKGSTFHSTKLSYSELVLILALWELGIEIKEIAALLKRQPVAVKTAVEKIKKTNARFYMRYNVE